VRDLRNSPTRQPYYCCYFYKEIVILTVDQLPDSRRAILVTLKRQGASTIAQLAEQLQLTGEAVRQQLLQLQREGWLEARVTRTSDRGRTGRPATSYSLTEAGDHLFPKHYDTLSISMMDAILDQLGPDALKKVLEKISDAKVGVKESAIRPLSLPARMQALKDWYLKDDPHMSVEQTEGGYRLIERNCPYINTAMNRPSLCSISVNALTKVLGFRVAREEKFQNGDGRCVFRVYSDDPVDEKAEFRLESEM
jgi:predicted ArsR family transcriptional regulator